MLWLTRYISSRQSYTVPLMISNQGLGWGAKIGIFYGSWTILYIVLLYCVFPEAKGRTYQELDELFEKGVPARHFATTKTAYQETDTRTEA